MSRTKLIETRVDADMHEVLPNRTLVEVIQKNLELVGPPKFDDREKAFARATQKDLKPRRSWRWQSASSRWPPARRSRDCTPPTSAI